jgi:hypothetical protein
MTNVIKFKSPNVVDEVAITINPLSGDSFEVAMDELVDFWNLGWIVENVKKIDENTYRITLRP